MAQYLLIESRDPFESCDTAYYYELASNLAKDGNDVTLFLVQNGVLPVRAGAKETGLAGVAGSGVEILADDFSLRERAIPENGLVDGVKPASLDVVIDQMADGRKTMWH